jgi:hypothetical protein
MKKIKLTKGKTAIIDDEDYPEISKYKWYTKEGHGSIFYAVRTPSSNGQKKIFMHRQILNFPNTLIDHINRNGLDNRKNNLRLCNKSQNHINCKKYKNNTSGYRGVSWHKYTQKWQARIQYQNKSIRIGYFKNILECAKAYDKKAKELFKDFAVLNFPEVYNG